MTPDKLSSFLKYADLRRFTFVAIFCSTILIWTFNSSVLQNDLSSLFKPLHIDDRIRVIHQELFRMKKRLEDKSKAVGFLEYSQQASHERTKVVLGFTEFFRQKPWGWMNGSKMFNHWDGIACPYFHCRLTFDNKEFKNADAVLFHAKDMPGRVEMFRLAKQKPKSQKWVYFALESPEYNPDAKWLNNLFHWTLTYRRDSDLYSPYGYYYRVTNGVKEAAWSIRKILNRKDRFVMWAASHCSLPREKFIKKLLKYINVDVYGGCAKHVGTKVAGECKLDAPKCNQLKRRYKFQLAFENSNCLDYVTEKYWGALKLGVVPIVLGGSSYNPDVAIPGSFVNAMNFTSVEALAEYLIYLNRNEDAYSRYHYWRKEFREVTFAPWSCTLCAALYMNTKRTYISRLNEFWSKRQQCGITDKIIEKIVDTG